MLILSTLLTSLRMDEGDDRRHVNRGDLMTEPHESSLTREYRRMQGNPNSKWHWRSDGHMWPSVGYETTRTSISLLPGLLCARCVQLDRGDGVTAG